jgi:hypothetical protein
MDSLSHSCSLCGDDDLENFYTYSNSATPRKQCIKCYGKLRRERYKQKAKKAELAKKKQYRQSHKDEIRSYRRGSYNDWFKELKRSLSCVDCGESRAVCLDFHHIDPSTKISNVSQMVIGSFSKELIIQEIAKCIPLCKNCHAVRTWGKFY